MSGDLPGGWRSAQLAEIATIKTGKTPSTRQPELWGGGIPFVTPSDLSDSLWAGCVERHLTDEGALCSTVAPAGSVLFTCIASIGKACVLTEASAFNQQINACLPKSFMDSGFLFAALKARTQHLKDMAGTTAVPIINKTTFGLTEIAFPPLDEQRRIAEVLRSVDEALHLGAATIATFTGLLSALRTELTHDADSPPAKVKSASLHDLCRPRQHPTISSQQLTDSGYPAFGANGQIGFYTSYTHEKPVIAITCRGATCGTINWIPAKSYLTGNAMALDEVRHDLINERYLFHYLSVWGVAKSIAGSAQPQITRQSLSGIKIAVPPMSEQVSIAAILDDALAQLEAASFTYSTLRTTRSQVASDLLSGRVRVPA